MAEKRDRIYNNRLRSLHTVRATLASLRKDIDHIVIKKPPEIWTGSMIKYRRKVKLFRHAIFREERILKRKEEKEA